MVRESRWKGSSRHCFGSVCRSSAAASVDKVAQTTWHNKKRRRQTNTQKSKAEFSENLHLGRSFSNVPLSVTLKICLCDDERPNRPTFTRGLSFLTDAAIILLSLKHTVKCPARNLRRSVPSVTRPWISAMRRRRRCQRRVLGTENSRGGKRSHSFQRAAFSN